CPALQNPPSGPARRDTRSAIDRSAAYLAKLEREACRFAPALQCCWAERPEDRHFQDVRSSDPRYHLPKWAPLSTCSTSPVTLLASVRYSTASAMSLGSPICPMGDSVRRKSFGTLSSNGVSTTPGATAFTRIPFRAYSIARLRVIALMPPLVIIGTDA